MDLKLYIPKIVTLFIGLFMFSLSSSMVSITSPSTIESSIIPISINQKGEILCKTRFSKNEMGAYSPMEIQYGFCIITKDTINEFITKTLLPTPESSYFKQKDYWDIIFKSKTNQQQLDEINKIILKNKYSFSLTDLNIFKINKVLSISKFEKNKNTSLKNNKQKGLKGAKSKEYFSDKKIRVLYDFGNIVILENDNNIDQNELELGANFDYHNSSNITTDNNGNNISLGFDISQVTGILIINNINPK
ncbi:hypothetical protein [Aquimarina sp. AD1]|uniref:hypothetical protein n=2 Tax=Aquimarina sp. (strain AD1) TaxID=1714848 RepID=UPI0013C33712|nr:hypothetical protein [Aquimarina sp. AD1]